MKYFDVSRDGKIQIDELNRQLRSMAKEESNREKYRILFKGEKEPLNQSTVSAISSAIALYVA